jgi:hypothetical protein
MKSKMICKVGKWVLYAGVLTGLAYSAIVVTAPRALASNCTPAECSNFTASGNNICNALGYGQFRGILCPEPGDPGAFEILCQFGTFEGNC